ncbi:MAG TPA: nucleotide disphospho-sugar-binding domain-containing protein, partial [Bdellovibrio sp.]|nr:nucleotide disphospho-sugar-binding domain-containing protein [Bdellovibrio sp.]
QHLLFKMIRHLDLEKYEVLVVGGAKLPFQHVNLHQTPSVDLESQVKNVDLVVTNGGSGSGYICLKNGIPFIAIASNLDQFQYSQAMTDKGVAQTLRADHFDGMEFMRVVAKMLHTSIYAVEASKIAKEILKDDPKRNILNFVSEILGVSQAEKETSESIVNSSNNMSFTDMIE